MTLLRIDDLRVNFLGVTALAGVSFELEPHTTHAVIGPNGAGKTSLLNAISGLVKLGGGRVLFRGREIQGSPAHRIAAQGIRRTFQHAEVIPDQTALENVLGGMYVGHNLGFWHNLLGSPAKRVRERAAVAAADDLLDRLDLRPYRDEPAADLPFGILKKVDLARSLVARPSLVMLDEPTSGMNDTEAERTMTACREVAAEEGISLLVIEHNMRVVMAVSDIVTVLDHGLVIAEGAPQEIQADPRVIRTYLGEDEVEEQGRA